MATSETPNRSVWRVWAVLAGLQLQRRSVTNANMTQKGVMSTGRWWGLDRFDFFHDLDARRTDNSRLDHRILEPGICHESVEGIKRLETGNHSNQVGIVDASIDA